jgi:hypothetical protein
MIKFKRHGEIVVRLHYDGSRAAKVVVEGQDVEIVL